MKKLLVNTFLVAGLAGTLFGQGQPPSFNITTVAGSATGGLGDGGTAAQAELIQPWDVKPDAAGNVYISDPGNQRVRKIDGVTGNITTLTTAISSPRGLALDSTGAFLYAAHQGGNRIRKIDTTTGAVTTEARARRFRATRRVEVYRHRSGAEDAHFLFLAQPPLLQSP